MRLHKFIIPFTLMTHLVFVGYFWRFCFSVCNMKILWCFKWNWSTWKFFAQRFKGFELFLHRYFLCSNHIVLELFSQKYYPKYHHCIRWLKLISVDWNICGFYFTMLKTIICLFDINNVADISIFIFLNFNCLSLHIRVFDSLWKSFDDGFIFIGM